MIPQADTQPTLDDWAEEHPDVCAGRHGGDPQSTTAHAMRRGKADAQRQRVREAIRATKAHGLTVDELSARWGVPPNAISGRFTELKGPRFRAIVKRGTRKTRTGAPASVWIDPAYAHLTP